MMSSTSNASGRNAGLEPDLIVHQCQTSLLPLLILWRLKRIDLCHGASPDVKAKPRRARGVAALETFTHDSYPLLSNALSSALECFCCICLHPPCLPLHVFAQCWFESIATFSTSHRVRRVQVHHWEICVAVVGAGLQQLGAGGESKRNHQQDYGNGLLIKRAAD